MVEKSKEQDEQLKRVDKYKHEKKQYESKVKNLKSEISTLNTKLGATTSATKEREVAISDMNKKLKGVSKTKEIINVCLTEASISIRAALGKIISSFYQSLLLPFGDFYHLYILHKPILILSHCI